MIDQLPRQIPLAYRPLVLPILIFVSLAILSLTLGQFVWGKIAEEKEAIASLQEKNSQLSAKKEVLTRQDKQALLAKTQAAVDAVPDQAPALAALSSLTYLANNAGIAVEDFGVSQRQDKKVEQTTSYLELNVGTSGPLSETLSFLAGLNSMAPLAKIIQIGSSVQNGIARTKTVLSSIWAPLPKDLGEPETPIEPLSGSDGEIANKLQTLKKPGGKSIEGLPPQGRNNPFNL